MFIVKLKTIGANFIGSPPFWADGTKVLKTVLMCVDVVESKDQLLNKCKLLFDLVVHQQQHLHCLWQHSINILVCLAKFERNFTKRNFYFETEGVTRTYLKLFKCLWHKAGRI